MCGFIGNFALKMYFTCISHIKDLFQPQNSLIFRLFSLLQARREGADADTDESWSSPDSSDEEEGGPDHVQCMSS